MSVDNNASYVALSEVDLEMLRKNTYLDPIFSSNAVLQRDRPVKLYGTGTGHVSVEFHGNTYEGVTEGNRFTVTLPPTPAGGPYEIKVNIEGLTTTLKNILFGDVIILAGQSNAELPINQTDYPLEGCQANDRVRTYYVGQHFTEEFTFRSILDNRWASLDKLEAVRWPAIAYHLGTRIENEYNVPVGIICVVKGASVIQSFMSKKAQSTFVFSPDELSVDHPCNTTVDRYKCYNQPSVIYDKMFSKVKTYTVSSVIWYQGESNIGRGESKVYDQMLQALIKEWRDNLCDDDLPFIIVKLHDMNKGGGWSAVREAQKCASENMKGCYLVDLDSLGICNDIHPKNKKDVSKLIFSAYYANLY